MTAIPGPWTSLPFSGYRRNPTFYLWYDLAHAAISCAVIGMVVASGFDGVLPTFTWWLPLLFPGALYVMIMAHVFCHNASHGSFPKPINRLVGELAGMVVLTKFASWEIVHRRHHRYSDDPEHDPHPAERNYWSFVVNTLVRVEQQLQQQYLDIYGDTPANRRYERIRSLWSFATGCLLAFMWFMVLGPASFFVLYLPAMVCAALFVIHFNWAGHNAHTKDGPIAPVNLDHGWYWVGNRIFFGIYYHKNHHQMAMLFNPMKMRPKRSERTTPDA